MYEGFGSSYQKARAAIEAIRTHFPDRRLVVVFEPHTFSWRNKDAVAWYDSVFSKCNKVYVYEPATQGTHTHEQLSQKEIVERVQKTGVDTTAIVSEKEGLQNLEKELQADDVILLMTSGNLGGLIESIPKLVEEKFQKKDSYLSSYLSSRSK